MSAPRRAVAREVGQVRVRERGDDLLRGPAGRREHPGAGVDVRQSGDLVRAPSRSGPATSSVPGGRAGGGCSVRPDPEGRRRRLGERSVVQARPRHTVQRARRARRRARRAGRPRAARRGATCSRAMRRSALARAASVAAPPARVGEPAQREQQGPQLVLDVQPRAELDDPRAPRLDDDRHEPALVGPRARRAFGRRAPSRSAPSRTVSCAERRAARCSTVRVHCAARRRLTASSSTAVASRPADSVRRRPDQRPRVARTSPEPGSRTERAAARVRSIHARVRAGEPPRQDDAEPDLPELCTVARCQCAQLDRGQARPVDREVAQTRAALRQCQLPDVPPPWPRARPRAGPATRTRT